MKYTLSSPVEFNGIEYKELTFREATTGDLMASDAVKGENSKMFAILASISDVPLPAFKKIKVSDLNKIMKATASLMGEPEESTEAGA
ncbi:phage tail assembly protein [Metarhizobium album]|uniref:Phage tail assembly protein n=1 Tax=Metarhizobium album TaxID=2182425 RepID=A0A2U2DSS7_9HYPH|nr:phage tail assembly protein [Rhizobium album]PWE56375.1 phage tail assembly protein [Rhizobium album]